MKVKTLSKEALAKLTGNLSSKTDDEPVVTAAPEEELEEKLEDVEDVETPVLSELDELKEKFEAVEAENVELKENLKQVEQDLEASAETITGSEELVTNLSENLRSVVNGMKISMNHVELDESVVGEALLKEFEHTATKFEESMPVGSLVEDPVVPTKQPQSAVQTLASSADYNNMPWSK